MTDPRVEIALAAVDEAVSGVVDALAALRSMIAAAAEPQPEPQPEPEPELLKPSAVTAVPTVSGRGISVNWAVPAGSPRTLISWGTATGGQIDRVFLTADQSSYLIYGLEPGAAYQVDVLSAQVDGSFTGDALVSLQVTTPPGEATSPGDSPAATPTAPDRHDDLAGWERWRAEMRAWCGAPSTGLRRLDPGDRLDGLPGWTWGGSLLRLTSTRPAPLRGLDIRAAIYVTVVGADIAMEDCRSFGAYWAEDRRGTFTASRCTIVASPGETPGRGGLQFWGTRPTLDRLDISGHADGVQSSERCRARYLWVHDLAVRAKTHNDGVQLYGNEWDVEHYLFERNDYRPNTCNGLVIANGTSAVFRCRAFYAESPGPEANVVNGHLGHVRLEHGVLDLTRGGRVAYPERVARSSVLELR